jgi:DNA-binding transcriptional LysR family regulator
MDLEKLRVFSAVAAVGNVTHAAARLGTSQPAVSKQLADLEQTLGVALFDRLPRGVRLTEAGQLLARHATQIFAIESRAEQELAELRGVRRGSLAVGASTTIGSYLIPGVFGAFHRAHPDVSLSLEIANTASIQAMVRDGRIDLGLTEGFVPGAEFDVRVVDHDEMVAIAAGDHALGRRARVRLADLLREPLIVRERGSGTRDVIEAALAEHGASVTPVMALGSTEAVKRAVAAGLGVAFVSRLALDLELASGALCVVALSDFALERALHMVRLAGKRASPAVDAFIDTLQRTLGAPV